MRDEENLAEMKESMRPPRRRFDFVIGNPPYIGYNECCKQKLDFTQRIKQKKLSMADVYGVNLNTVPNRIKPYSPKPNLYAFFIALGLSLLKNDSKICYIIPQTILTANDLDVLRYHLSSNTSIEKLITFVGKMFIGRGLKQNKPVATSSLIFVINSTQSKNGKVKITNYEDSCSNNFQDYFTCAKKVCNELEQHYLRSNIENWNFVGKDKGSAKLLKEYSLNSVSIEEFRNKLNENSDLVFDGGVKIDQSLIKNKENGNDFEIFDYKRNNWELYKPVLSQSFYSKDDPIEFIPGSQKLRAFTKNHKIIWRTKFNGKFQYTTRNILLINNQSLIISSNSKNNILFLFSCLNNDINLLILKEKLLLPNETNYLIPIKAIKQYIRIPKITKDKTFVKDEIVEQIEKLLDLEDCQLQDFVDFSGITKQKFDYLEVRGNNLVLTKGGEEYKAPIKSKKDLIKTVLKENFGEKELLPGDIVLSELKHLTALDKDLQKTLKNYIDDLVFALYFNVPVKKVGLSNASQIKDLCRKNEFYDYIQTEIQKT
ncbi:MAG: Eco57I restriction-modification methylase domain-containing protein [Phycisphaerae bacterium]|nr:Eco57I restriction-modification methylase domain-containing protein [Phycisphaerae bacterium]